jgi:ATP adenylyltransferase
VKQLWAPWRMVYIDHGGKNGGCIFCAKNLQEQPRESLVLTETKHSLVMLNKFPYNNGHLLLAPKRHENKLDDLPQNEHSDLQETLRRSVAIVRTVLNPGGINLGMNLGKCAGAGVEDHLHWHLVPRWEGDTNFMPVVGETRVMPQHLLDSYDRLKPHFESLAE